MSQDEKARELLLDLRNILEAWIGKVDLAFGENRQRPMEVKLSYNVDALKWELRTPKEEGKKSYEIAQDDGSENFKNLVKAVDSAGEKGMFTRFGSYWVMFEGKAVGRRARKK